jgi:hypothetical protein
MPMSETDEGYWADAEEESKPNKFITAMKDVAKVSSSAIGEGFGLGLPAKIRESGDQDLARVQEEIKRRKNPDLYSDYNYSMEQAGRGGIQNTGYQMWNNEELKEQERKLKVRAKVRASKWDKAQYDKAPRIYNILKVGSSMLRDYFLGKGASKLATMPGVKTPMTQIASRMHYLKTSNPKAYHTLRLISQAGLRGLETGGEAAIRADEGEKLDAFKKGLPLGVAGSLVGSGIAEGTKALSKGVGRFWSGLSKDLYHFSLKEPGEVVNNKNLDRLAEDVWGRLQKLKSISKGYRGRALRSISGEAKIPRPDVDLQIDLYAKKYFGDKWKSTEAQSAIQKIKKEISLQDGLENSKIILTDGTTPVKGDIKIESLKRLLEKVGKSGFGGKDKDGYDAIAQNFQRGLYKNLSSTFFSGKGKYDEMIGKSQGFVNRSKPFLDAFMPSKKKSGPDNLKGSLKRISDWVRDPSGSTIKLTDLDKKLIEWDDNELKGSMLKSITGNTISELLEKRPHLSSTFSHMALAAIPASTVSGFVSRSPLVTGIATAVAGLGVFSKEQLAKGKYKKFLKSLHKIQTKRNSLPNKRLRNFLLNFTYDSREDVIKSYMKHKYLMETSPDYKNWLEDQDEGTKSYVMKDIETEKGNKRLYKRPE